MHQSSDWAGWHPPEKLRGAVPRRVRPTGLGLTVLVVLAFVVVVGDTSVWLTGECRRQQTEIDRVLADGRHVEGIVTRLWRTDGRGPHYHLAYQYFANGRQFVSQPFDIDLTLWRGLQVGSTVAVLYLPSDPANNFPLGNPPYVIPTWVGPVTLCICFAFGAVLLQALIRDRRRTAFGQPAPGVVTHVGEKRPNTDIGIFYEFEVAGGARYGGNSSTSDQSVVEGSVVCILYDPEKPDRNTPYLSARSMWVPV